MRLSQMAQNQSHQGRKYGYGVCWRFVSVRWCKGLLNLCVGPFNAVSKKLFLALVFAGSSTPLERGAEAGRDVVQGAGVLRALGGQGVLALHLAPPGPAAEEVRR